MTGALDDFLTDLREHDAAEEVSVLVFTEFGRRMKDNGSGTDHGSGAARSSLARTSRAGSTPSIRRLTPKTG